MDIKRFLESKKGGGGGLTLTLEQVIKLILVIFGVLLMIYIGFLLARLFFGANQSELQAKGTLENLYNTINALNTDGTPKDIDLYAPVGWTIVAFDNVSNIDRTTNTFKKPYAFIDKFAICICKESCNADFCREIKKPLITRSDDGRDVFFVLKIAGIKHFEIWDAGAIYMIGKKSMTLALQDPIRKSTALSDIGDNDYTGWDSRGTYAMTVYFTPYEPEYDDFDAFCDVVVGRNGQNSEGSGLGKDNKTVYDSNCNPISAPYNELGITKLGTDLTPGRTIAVSSLIKERSAVYIKFDCDTMSSACNTFCEEWNNHYYIAEDVGSAINDKKIDLYVGLGKAQYQHAMECIPSQIEVWVGPKIDESKIKQEDENNVQRVVDVQPAA
jgi:3D (Asp-Asp-Asp) domain-containing protein